MLISAPLEHLHSGIIFSIVSCLNLLLHLFYDLAKYMYEKPILEHLSNNNCVLGTSPSVWCVCVHVCVSVVMTAVGHGGSTTSTGGP